MTPEDFKSLLRCRKEREQEGEKTLVRCLEAHAAAEQSLARLREAARTFVGLRQAREAALYRDVTGRKVSLAALDRLNAILAEMAQTAESIRAGIEAAIGEERRTAALVDEARVKLAELRRASLKWEDLADSAAREASAHAEAIAELELEEAAGDRFRLAADAAS